jgi:hypothetical protein
LHDELTCRLNLFLTGDDTAFTHEVNARFEAVLLLDSSAGHHSSPVLLNDD